MAFDLRHHILVLGGGLAGAAAAVHLARAGRIVSVVEREPTPKHKVCGEFLSTEALHLLRDLGIRPEEHGAHTIGTVRLASRRHITETRLPFVAQSLTRRCLDPVMLDAAEQAGAHVLRGTAVTSLHYAQQHWHAHLSNSETLVAGAAILASGKHDLRGFPRPPGKQSDLVGLKMYFRLAPAQTQALQHAVELLLHPYGYTGLQLVEDGVANLCALVRRSHFAALGSWPAFLQELIARNAHARERLESATPLLDKPLAISSIPYGFVRRGALGDGLYAVGDQAAVIPSFTGDGMSVALYTGAAAAQAILAGETSDAFQRRMHATLRWQVARATAISRAIVHPAVSPVVGAAVHRWPWLMGQTARSTRLPVPALRPELT